MDLMSTNNINQIIENIKNAKYSEKELINLYKNASKQNVQSIIDAVKIKMRTDFPRAATRMFGAKETEATSYLESIHQRIMCLYDLKGNQSENKIWLIFLVCPAWATT